MVLGVRFFWRRTHDKRKGVVIECILTKKVSFDFSIAYYKFDF